MYGPDIHACSQLQVENEQLIKKVRRLKRRNAELQQELGHIQEQQRMKEVLRQYATTRNMETQTDPQRAVLHTHPRPSQKPDKPPENDKLNKVLSMHNNLMRRYEKELKTSMHHVETITTLNLKVNELEQKLREAQMIIQRLEKEKADMKARPRLASARTRTRAISISSSDDDMGGLLKELQNVRRERDKLAQDKKKLKDEIKGLDHGFFEEVEDLKFALQQSLKLNKEYDKSLKKLCKQFGVPFPHPQQQMP